MVRWPRKYDGAHISTVGRIPTLIGFSILKMIWVIFLLVLNIRILQKIDKLEHPLIHENSGVRLPLFLKLVEKIVGQDDRLNTW